MQIGMPLPPAPGSSGHHGVLGTEGAAAIQYLGCASLRGIVRTVAVHQVTIPSLLQRAHYFENSWLAVPDDEEASNATMSHSPSNAGLGLADLLRRPGRSGRTEHVRPLCVLWSVAVSWIMNG